MSEHPFLAETFFVAWSKLQPDRVVPDIEMALARAAADVAAIAAIPAAEVTFENTFLALEDATERLSRAWGLVSHLSTVCDTPELRDAFNTMLPKVSEFQAGIPLNTGLWTALTAFAGTPAARALTGTHRRFFEETVAEFRQHGADLPADKKRRLEALQAELAAVTQKYSENVLDSTNAWELVVDDEGRLAGLPAAAREAARRNALAKGLGTEASPRWRFTLHQPSLEPFMTYVEDDALRRMMWEGSTAVGWREPHDNTPLIRRILELRRERATLLGKNHFADLALERRMAKNGATALAFVEDMHARVREAFGRECAELEAFKAGQTGQPAGPLEPWELAFWAEKLRRARYDFDEEALRPYLPLDRVIEGMFRITERLFGLRICEHAEKVETWHPEVKVYDVFDAGDGRLLGSFYTDWHPRESKRSGAWMNYLATGGPRADGTRSPHLGLMCGNLTAPLDGRAAQLRHREAETVFHEFGHLLHHLLGEVEIKSLNGVNVAWDFVELPSQILENWTWERESLDLFARHAATGAPIPQALFERMRAARNFRGAAAAMRQLSFGRMDLAMHMEPERFLAADDLEAALRELLADYTIPTRTPAPTLVRRFGHLFSEPVGYAAGYYSYKWAEVLDADAFTRFLREGLFNADAGRAFREHILSRGNAEDPLVLFRRFMGRDPDPTALLVRSGLVPG